MLFPKKACQAFIGLVNKYWSQKKVKIFVLLGFKQLCGAYLVTQSVKNLPAMQETWVQSLGWEDPLEKGKGYPFQYVGLENSMDCIVHGVAKTWTRLNNLHFHKIFFHLCPF